MARVCLHGSLREKKIGGHLLSYELQLNFLKLQALIVFSKFSPLRAFKVCIITEYSWNFWENRFKNVHI